MATKSLPLPPQSNSNAPQRIPSFVGLPPIRRASTFGSSLLSLDSPGGISPDSDSQPPPLPSGPHPRSSSPPTMAAPTTQMPGAAQGPPMQFMTGPPPPGQQVQNIYRPTPTHPPRNLSGGPPHQPTVNGAGPQGNQGNQGSQPPFAAPGMGGRPGMMPPHMMNHHLQRLPPQAQGGWVVQESHLSEPLQQTNRHRTSPSNSSTQQPFYGYDKEAGVPETAGLAGEDDRDDDGDEDSITQARRPSQTNAPPPLHIGQALTSNKPAAALPHNAMSPPSRTNTGELQTPSPVFGADEARGRRQSSIFTSIKGKLSGSGSGTSPVLEEGRRGSFGPGVGNSPVDGDSEAGKGASMNKRLPFSRLRNSENASDETPTGSQDSIVAHSSGTPMQLPDGPSPFPPPEKKRSFFSTGATPTLKKERTDLSMDSPNGSGKKGFSALIGKFRPGNSNGVVESPKESKPPAGVPGGFGGAPPSANGSTPGLGQPPSGPGLNGGSQNSLAAPPPAIMRGRSDSTSSGFSFQPSQTSQVSLPQQQQLTGDVDKKRNVTGGMFGFGKLKKSDIMPESASPQAQTGSGAGQSPLGQGPPGGIPPNQVPPATAPGSLGPSPQTLGVPARVPVGQNPAGRVSFALPPSAEHPAGQIVQSQLPQAQMGRGQSPSDQTPPAQMGRGQVPGEQDRPASMGRGQTLQVQDANRPSSMGRGQGPDSRPSSMGRGQLAPPGQFGRGQLPPFAPGMAMGPGFGMQTLGPDGRPIVLQGQFNPQTGQFVVLLPPGVAPPTGPLQNIRPIVPGSQLSLLPPLPESRPPSQHGGDHSAKEQPQTNGVHLHTHSHSPLSQSVSASQKDLTRTDESTPPSSRLEQHQDSPNSQATSLEQSRSSLNTTPIQYQQSAPPPQPSVPGPHNQLPARKPVQLTDNPSPLDGPSPGGYKGHRSSSSSIGSQAQSDQARRASGQPSNHRLSSQSQVPPPAPSAAQAAQLAPSQGPSPRASMQSLPPQQFVQPAQPGAPFFAPGQAFPPGQFHQMPPFGAPNPNAFAGQQPPPNGISPPSVTTAIPKEKEQSTLSKLLKGAKTPTTPGTPNSEKERKSFFGFRRESKQPAQKPAQGQTQGPPQGPPQAMQQGIPQALPGQLPGQPPMGQPFPPIMPLQRQMTGPQPVLMPLHPQMTGPQPLRPQMTGPQPLRPQMTGPQPLRPQMTGPQPMLVPLQPQMTGGQPGMMMQPQLMMIPQQMGRGNNGEPQYAQVPIPRGYGYVHAEGGVAPAAAPYIVGLPGGGFAMPTMPVLQPGMSPQQLWPPGVVRPAWAAPMPGQPMLQPQHTGTTITGAPAPLVPQPTGTTVIPEQPSVPSQAPAAMVHPVEPQQHTTPTPPAVQQHSGQPTPVSPQASLPSQSQVVSPASITSPEGQFPNISTNGNAAPPQLRHPGSPQGYPVPHSAFSPINPAANNLPNPPLPANLAAVSQNQQNGGLTPQRQASAVSQISSLRPGQSQGSNFSSPVSHISAAGISKTPSPQITPDRNVSPEPARGSSPSETVEDSRNVSPEQPVQPFQAPTAMRVQPVQAVNGTRPHIKHTSTASIPRNSLTVQPQTPRSPHSPQENLYDATPRHSTISAQYRDDPKPSSAEPKSPGPSQEISKARAPSPIDERPVSIQSVTATQPPPPPRLAIDDMDTPPPANSTERELFERTKRQMTLRDQEEKIPVFPSEPDPVPQKKKEEEQPQMSATSYPGQEWNPYEAGYGDWDD